MWLELFSWQISTKFVTVVYPDNTISSVIHPHNFCCNRQNQNLTYWQKITNFLGSLTNFSKHNFYMQSSNFRLMSKHIAPSRSHGEFTISSAFQRIEHENTATSLSCFWSLYVFSFEIVDKGKIEKFWPFPRPNNLKIPLLLYVAWPVKASHCSFGL